MGVDLILHSGLAKEKVNGRRVVKVDEVYLTILAKQENGPCLT